MTIYFGTNFGYESCQGYKQSNKMIDIPQGRAYGFSTAKYKINSMLMLHNVICLDFFLRL